jgi:hypothetical protein
MRALLVVALTALASAALAGCIGTSATAPTEQGPTPTGGAEAGAGAAPGSIATGAGAASGSEAPEAWMEVYPFQGRITLGVGAAGAGYFSPTGTEDPHLFFFNVQPGATAIVAEMRWADATQDLDLELLAPSCDPNTGDGGCIFVDGGTIGRGDSPVRFVLTDAALLAMDSDWGVAVWAKNAVQVPFEAAITVFYGGMPADEYTAMG